MRLIKITYVPGVAMCADLECEHCGAKEKLTDASRTDNADLLPPAMHCESCGKNRAGDVKAAPVGYPVDSFALAHQKSGRITRGSAA